MSLNIQPCAHQGCFPGSKEASPCQASGQRAGASGVRSALQWGEKNPFKSRTPYLGDRLSGRLGRCGGEQGLGRLAQKGDTRSRGLPGSSRWRILLRPAVDSQEETRAGSSVLTAVRIVSVSGFCRPVWTDHRPDLATSPLRNFYHFLSSEQSQRDTISLSSVPSVLARPLKPHQPPAGPSPAPVTSPQAFAHTCWSLFKQVTLLPTCSLPSYFLL